MRFPAALLALTFSLAFAVAAHAVTWSWDKSSIDLATNSGWGPSCRIGPAGTWRVAYWTPGVGITLEGAGWSRDVFPGPDAPQLAPQGAATADEAKLLLTSSVWLALDAQDQPWISHVHTNQNCGTCTYPIRVSHRVAGEWTTEDFATGHFAGPIDLGPDGLVQTVYADAADQTVWARRDAANAWTQEPVAVAWPALRVDASNRPHLAGANAGLVLAVRDAGTWDVRKVGTSTSPVEVSLALDAAGDEHVAWYEYGGGAREGLWYGERVGGVWSEHQLTSGPNSGRLPAVGLDPSGEPMVGFCAYTSASLVLMQRKYGQWSASTIESANYPRSSFSMAVDPQGTPYVVWPTYAAAGVQLAVGAAIADVPRAAPAGAFALRLAGRSPLAVGEELAFAIASPEPGEVSLECLDPAGRLVDRAPRSVSLGESIVRWRPGVASPGVYFVRARLAGASTAPVKAVFVR